jgi:hypothetical protein
VPRDRRWAARQPAAGAPRPPRRRGRHGQLGVADDLPLARGAWPVADDELWRTFNCGVGMVAVVDAADADRAVEVLAARDVDAWRLGTVVPHDGGQPRVRLTGVAATDRGIGWRTGVTRSTRQDRRADRGRHRGRLGELERQRRDRWIVAAVLVLAASRRSRSRWWTGPASALEPWAVVAFLAVARSTRVGRLAGATGPAGRPWAARRAGASRRARGEGHAARGGARVVCDVADAGPAGGPRRVLHGGRCS